MADPMDSPPADHGSDRYGYIEIQAPAGEEPPVELLERVSKYPACQDCNANVFIRWNPNMQGEYPGWEVIGAHDDGCPTFAAIERGV